MLPTDQNLAFLKPKIMQVKTGLCCIEDNCFDVRTSIVEVLYLDNSANLYFMVPNPLLSFKKIESFGVTLTFYRKILDYYVQLKASAIIEKNEDDCNENETAGKFLLIKAKIMEADYVEHKKPFAQHKRLDNLKDSFRRLSKAVTVFFY